MRFNINELEIQLRNKQLNEGKGKRRRLNEAVGVRFNMVVEEDENNVVYAGSVTFNGKRHEFDFNTRESMFSELVFFDELAVLLGYNFDEDEDDDEKFEAGEDIKYAMQSDKFKIDDEEYSGTLTKNDL